MISRRKENVVTHIIPVALFSSYWLANLGAVAFLLTSCTYTPASLSTHFSSLVTDSTSTVTDSSATTVSTTLVNTSTVLDRLADAVVDCLLQSDAKRNDGFDGASTGWTSWIHEPSVQVIQDNINLALSSSSSAAKGNTDEAYKWLRWLSLTPQPTMLDATRQFRSKLLCTSSTTRHRVSVNDSVLLARRVGCSLLALPSGATLPQNLQTPPGGIVLGALLLGGVTRYRLIGGGHHRRPRRVGEKRVLSSDPFTSWLQYGGPERNYEAVDIGPCLVMEITLLPEGLPYNLSHGGSGGSLLRNTHVTTPAAWNLDELIQEKVLPVVTRPNETIGEKTSASDVENVKSNDLENGIIQASSSIFLSLGGLTPQIDEIVRRVLDGRVVARHLRDSQVDANSTQSTQDCRRDEMQSLADLGLHPVQGLLLYGPPGCGKTALARKISEVLASIGSRAGQSTPPPKIVAAPELLDRWVGGTEKLVRELFRDAEKELVEVNGDATLSALHVIVIDEIDAVFRKRTSFTDGTSGEVVRASAVNQILAKLDGVNALGNVLLIGMTNRKELLDPALLRPGRLEVHVEIPLPDKQGRREILKIHFARLRQQGRLSQLLCRAIDGVDGDVDATSTRKKLVQRFFLKRFGRPASTRTINDLAADHWTKDFSGADIAGLVRCSASIALTRSRKQMGHGFLDNFMITLEDVKTALQEVKS